MKLGVTLDGQAEARRERRLGQSDQVAAGQEGEIQVRGPQLMPGYYENPAENTARFEDGAGGRKKRKQKYMAAPAKKKCHITSPSMAR